MRCCKLAAGLSIEGSLLDEHEIKDLLGDKAGIRRSHKQVIKAVSDRIDYVEKNVATIEKKLESDEAKLEKLLIVSYPGEKTEEGLPFMEITEYLDDDDNIISMKYCSSFSFTLLTFPDATVNGKDPTAATRNIDARTLSQFEQFIDNAGKDTAITNPSVPLKSGDESRMIATSGPLEDVKQEETVDARSKSVPGEEKPDEKTPPVASSPSSTVLASENPSRKETSADGPDPTTDGSTEVDEPFMAHESGGYVKVLPDPEIPESSWVQEVPGESESETALRQEMLRYNMSEIGEVVAELNLEESGDFYGYEGYSDEDDDEYDSEATSEEDEYGRTINKRVMNTSYRREMEELQQLIKDREAKLTEKKTSVQPQASPPAQSSTTMDDSSNQEKPKQRKGVRFNEELDISPAPAVPADNIPQPSPTPSAAAPFTVVNIHDIAPEDDDALPYLTELMARTGMYNAGPMDPAFETPPPIEKPREKGPSLFKREKQTSTAPAKPEQVSPPQVSRSTISDTVLERPPVAPSKSVSTSALSENVLERAPAAAVVPPSAPVPPKKLSRFRQSQLASAAVRNSSPSPAPQPQPILSASVVERGPSDVASDSASVKPPDDMDPEFHRKEVAQSYHKLRNKMIQQQGGFKRTEDREEDSIVELEENGEVKKVSRFKAARLRGLGPQ